MSEARPAQLFCGTCLAPLKATDPVCSRCGQRVGKATAAPFVDAELANPFIESGRADIDRGTSASFSIGTLLLVITIIGVLLGITVAAPGLGIALTLLAVPPAIRTVLVVRRRSDGRLKTGRLEKAGLFLMSAFVTWVIVVCVISSCCLTFCGVCVGGMALSQGRTDESVLILFASCSAIVVAILVIWAFSFWIRRRWRTDISKW